MDFSFSTLSALFDFSIVEYAIGATLLLAFSVQILFYFLLYRKPYAYAAKQKIAEKTEVELPSISVVITSKNESENLAKTLPPILEQNYPSFEVIVVNSGSTDETDMVLRALEQKYTNLYHTYIPAEAEELNEKKLALTLGIKAAKNDYLVFTEAYCKPSSERWIEQYGVEFAKGSDIVLGFCKLRIAKKVRMRKFMLYDNMIHGLKYLSMAIVGKPFMGIGRNMGYRKELFFRHKGFSAILNIDGGEDDLFINKTVKRQKTTTLLLPESMTETDIVDNFFTWRALKSKYLYTKQYYKGARSFIFGWETFSKYVFIIAFACAMAWGLIFGNYALPASAALLLLVRFGIQVSIINKNSQLMEAGKYHINLFFLDLFQPFNNFRFRTYAFKRNMYKSRR